MATAQSNNNTPVPAQQAASGSKAGAVLKAQQPRSGQQPESRQDKASRISSKVLKSTQDAASAAPSNVK